MRPKKITETICQTKIIRYFVNGDYKAFAITPLADSVLVSYTTVEQGFYNRIDLSCDYKDSKILSESDEDITITKTDKGIKVETKDKKLKTKKSKD